LVFGITVFNNNNDLKIFKFQKILTDMDELIEMYRMTTREENYRIDKKLLKKNNFSEMQWISFLNLVEELELNEVGARIILDEIRSGRVVLK
jgi:flagellar basal body P-ring protein FlgI